MKPTLVIRFFAAFFLLSAVACSPLRTNRISFGSLDADQYAKLIQKENVTLVDVRTAEEFAAGHIVGAKYNIDVRKSTFIDDAEKALPDKGIIAVYCKGGVRSKTAASQLAARGYKVVELRTGYDGWVKSGGKTEK
jgi:rhodanese-related sulfurtransferase